MRKKTVNRVIIDKLNNVGLIVCFKMVNETKLSVNNNRKRERHFPFLRLPTSPPPLVIINLSKTSAIVCSVCDNVCCIQRKSIVVHKDSQPILAQRNKYSIAACEAINTNSSSYLVS